MGHPLHGTLVCMEVWPERFHLLDDLSESDWLRDRLDDWTITGSTTVTSTVPHGYDAYVRVLHPTQGDSPVTWSDVARWSGRVLHPLAQWNRISKPATIDRGALPFDAEPLEGKPPLEVLKSLVGTLRHFTSTPESTYLGIWDGWGFHPRSIGFVQTPHKPRDSVARLEAFVADRWTDVDAHPTFELPGRTYLLGTGPIEVVVEVADTPLEVAHISLSKMLGVPVALWWPSDRTWFVASEIDFDSTLVAGTGELLDSLLADDSIEAFEVPPDGILSNDGDRINLDVR